MKKFFLVIFWGLLWWVALLTWVWHIARWLLDAQSGLVTLGFVIAPWGLVVLSLLLLIALLAGRHYLSLMLGIAAALIIMLFAPLFLPSWMSAPTGVRPLKVMSFNVWYNNPQLDVPGLATLIRQERPDIVLLQEVDRRLLARLRADLNDLYGTDPLYVAADAPSLQAVLSRYPVQQLSAETDRSRLQKTRIETPLGALVVWNIHAYRANFLPIGRNFLSYGADFAAHRKAEHQFDWLLAEAEGVREPLIIGGDFNIPHQSAEFQLLTQQFKEAHWEAGWGFGFTFPASSNHIRYASLFGRSIPLSSPTRLVRLDHIFYDAHFVAQAARTLSSSAGSDHAPIVAELWQKP